MQLEPLFRMKVELGARYPVGAVPSGRRTVWALAGGEIVGPRIRAEIVPIGGEFELVDSAGIYRMDVRMLLRTLDGAHIYVQYSGVAELSSKAEKKLGAGHAMEFGEQHFFTQPRFETGDQRYAWLNRTVAVAEGRMFPRAVEYLVYQCLPGGEIMEPKNFEWKN